MSVLAGADVERVLAALPPRLHARARAEALERVRRRQGANRAAWRADPLGWARTRAKVHLWSKQAAALEALRDHRRVAVPSGHDLGKSFLAACAAHWWLDSHPPGEAFVITTAPTFPQVRAILWREIRALHKRMDNPLGRVNQTEWLIDDELVAFGRKPADHDAAGFQGVRARYTLIIIDEASGIPDQLWTAADSIAANDNAAILVLGNPADPTSHFAKVCDSPAWHVIRISAFDSPAFTGEDVPASLLDSLVSARWVEEKRLEWGEDSPLWFEKVLGIFPVDASFKVVRASDLAKCRQVRDDVTPPALLLPVTLGMDVGQGSDWTVVRERRGRVAGREWQERTTDPDKAVELVGAAVVVTGARTINIDAGGPGWAMVPAIKAWLKEHRVSGVHIVPVRFGAASKEPEKYKNIRAELWWGIGRLFSQDGVWDLSEMENGDTTCAQLADPKWHLGVGDRIVIEAKDDIRKRTGRSPDSADALLLAYASRGGPGDVVSADQTARRLPVGVAAAFGRTSSPRVGGLSSREVALGGRR